VSCVRIAAASQSRLLGSGPARCRSETRFSALLPSQNVTIVSSRGHGAKNLTDTAEGDLCNCVLASASTKWKWSDMEAADEQRLIRDAFDRPAGLFDADGRRLDVALDATQRAEERPQ
jgi:hypothetical protein